MTAGATTPYDKAKANRLKYDWDDHVTATPAFVGRRFLDDILRQPTSLASAVRLLGGAARLQLYAAASALRRARPIYLTGIGSSYHPALAAFAFFYRASCPVYLQDAAGFLHFARLPGHSLIVIISRSGEGV